MILMFAILAAFVLRFARFVAVSFEFEFTGCKLVCNYFYVNGLGYWFLAAAISEFIVKSLNVVQKCLHL